MPVGLEVYNSNGVLVVSTGDLNVYAVAAGSVTIRPPQVGSTIQDYMLRLSAANLPTNAPILLVRPRSPNAYIGASGSWATTLGRNLFVQGQSPFDWVLLSGAGSPIEQAMNYGFEVLSPGGTRLFSSNYTYGRLKTLHVRPAAAGGSGWPMVRPTGFSKMPWIVANNLRVTFRGMGETSESMGAIMAAVSSNFASITYNFMDVARGNSVPFPGLVERGAYDPFRNVKESLWLADVPGI